MTVVLFISSVSSVLSDELLIKNILPLARSLAFDPVANIRFASVGALESLYSRLDKKTLQEQVKPVLESLEEDKDVDVKVAAAQALKNL